MDKSLFTEEGRRYIYVNPCSNMCYLKNKLFIPVCFYHIKYQEKDFGYYSRSTRTSIKGTYTRLYTYLQRSYSGLLLATRKDVNLHVNRGLLQDEDGNIHFLVTINKDTKLLRLYLSLDFVTKDKFKNIYRRFQKDFIWKWILEGVDLRVVKSINDLYVDKPSITFTDFEEEINYFNNLGYLLCDEEE